MVKGRWPIGIDHENGIRSDNRWSNLREAEQSENCMNVAKRSDNTSGVTGVSWDRFTKKWYVSIKGNFLGRFHCLNRAILVRKSAEREYGFHSNHGR